MVAGGTPAGAAGSSLLTGLQFYYALENVNDSSVNALNLTNNGSATFVAGKVNNCLLLDNTAGKYLSHADAAGYQMGTGSFTICCWVNFTVDENFHLLSFYGTNGISGYGWKQAGDIFQFYVGDLTQSHSIPQPSGPQNNGAWHLFVATVDRSLNLATVYTDNVAGTPVDITDITGSVNAFGGAGFVIGSDDGTTNAKIDETGLWNRILTGSEITALWNSGAGTTYPF